MGIIELLYVKHSTKKRGRGKKKKNRELIATKQSKSQTGSQVRKGKGATPSLMKLNAHRGVDRSANKFVPLMGGQGFRQQWSGGRKVQIIDRTLRGTKRVAQRHLEGGALDKTAKYRTAGGGFCQSEKGK